jgi:phosphoribosyl 1,2-cyclic phosphate phosphodiesterase
MYITFLGTGTSNGVPVIGCTCDVCTSSDPHDRRMRTSALVSVDGQKILIDAGPELRVQALVNGVNHIDAVAFTHAHADHVAGFDDLRSFNYLNQDQIDVYADQFTADLLRERFAYAFDRPLPFFGGKPDVRMHVFNGPFEIGATPITPFPVAHGRWIVSGFRIYDLVYLTDAKSVPQESIDVMRGAEVMVINALRPTPHPVHLSIGEALEIIERVQPRHAYLTHLSHEVSHAAVSASLPANVSLAHDGLTVELQGHS